MEMREFLPGEPVVGDIVVCIDGSFPARARLRHFEVPREDKLYRIRRTEDCLDADWGELELLRLAPHPEITAFHLPVKGWWTSLRFKATHDPQRDWPRGAGPDILKAAAGSLDEGKEAMRRLWLARQCGAWRQLCQSNFGLGLALTVLHPSPCDAPAEWLKRLKAAASLRRLEICRQLGFPASASTLRILSRLHVSWGQAFSTMSAKSMLLVLHQLLIHDPAASSLLDRHRTISKMHVKQLAFGCGEVDLQYLFTDETEVLGAAWFFRLPAAQRHWLAAELQTTSNRENQTPGITLLPRPRRLGTFQREKDVVAYLTDRQRRLDLLDSWTRSVSSSPRSNQWPEPPLPGSDLIQPITCHKQLREEGETLKHCIQNYADQIALGVYFAYSMVGPTRCTVGLKWHGEQWKVDAIRGTGNKRIDEEQTKMVIEWVDSHTDHTAILRPDLAREMSRLIRSKRPPPDLATTSRRLEFGLA